VEGEVVIVDAKSVGTADRTRVMTALEGIPEMAKASVAGRVPG
jgi:hypothetical protein